MLAKNQLLSLADALALRRRLIYKITWFLGIIFAAAFTVQHGNLTRTQEFHGSFRQNPNAARNIVYQSAPTFRSCRFRARAQRANVFRVKT